jgi:4-carboxymuconolactone decarboxylase
MTDITARSGTTAILVVALAMSPCAQDRMPPIAPEKMTEAQKKAADEFTAARGSALLGPFVPLLRSPEVLSRARAMGDYLRFKSALPPRLSEFVILITARQWTQQYEWDAHYALALKAGLKPAIAQALAEGRRPEGMAEDEQILYDFCIELHHGRSVSDATYQRAVAKFGEQGVIDAIGISGYYTLLAMVMNTARTPLPAGRTPGLPPLPR